MFERIINCIKPLIFKYNKVYPVLRGPLRGFKIKLTENIQYSPLIGNWEPVTANLFTKIIKPSAVIFDLGAQAGIHTLLFSKLTRTNGKVFAFEPFIKNLEELETNIKLNNLTNIRIINKAVSNFNGRSVFLIGKHAKQGSLYVTGNETDKTIEVDVLTLDNFIISLNNIYPDFIKIDIEGSEKNALLGFEKTVMESYPTLYIESHNYENELGIINFIVKFDYNAYLVDGSYNNYSNDLNLPHLINIEVEKNLFSEDSKGRGSILCVHPSRIHQIRMN